MDKKDSGTYRLNLGLLKSDWPIILLLLGSLILGFIAYPYLPEKVPSHWNTVGQIDSYSSRLWGAFFLPLFNVGLYVLFLLLPLIDPQRDNYVKFAGTYRILRVLIITFITAIFLIVIISGLGYRLNVGILIQVAASLLFIVIGNLMGQLRHNYFVGIKTPWTLASEKVWTRTHRVSARVWVLAGLLGLVGVLFDPQIGFWFLIGPILAAAAFSVIYSYLIYRHEMLK